ncbi:MAG: hypothetical protein QM768_17905 [Agriterribacter sp.]
MKRRHFFRDTALTVAGTSLLGSLESIAGINARSDHFGSNTANNIIFMVSDGMSTGTLNLANLLLQRKEGRTSTWISLYQNQLVQRALMDTASASALLPIRQQPAPPGAVAFAYPTDHSMWRQTVNSINLFSASKHRRKQHIGFLTQTFSLKFWYAYE